MAMDASLLAGGAYRKSRQKARVAFA